MAPAYPAASRLRHPSELVRPETVAADGAGQNRGCRRTLLMALAFLMWMSGCKPASSGFTQGYVEGEFVYVAAPLAGKLEKLWVKRGDQVAAGAALFEQESVVEKATLNEAERRLSQAQANLEDAKKGRRPTEIASLRGQLNQAVAALDLAKKDLERLEKLSPKGATSQGELDEARSRRDQNTARISQLEADIATAELGARPDAIAALESEVKAREAAVARAARDLAEKKQAAPQSGLVFDTLFREGEFVAAGRPVVMLLPPQNIKVRAFVDETRLGTIHHGDGAQVVVDGVGEPFVGKVTFISPQAEYTPPVIYSREERAKLVFMIEIEFELGAAAKLHPGQPVEVSFQH